MWGGYLVARHETSGLVDLCCWQGGQRKTTARVPGNRDGRDSAPNPEAARDLRDPRAPKPKLGVGNGLMKSFSQQAVAGVGRAAAPVQSRPTASPKHARDGRSAMAEPVLSRPALSLDKPRSSKNRPLSQGRGIFFACALCAGDFDVVGPRPCRDLNDWGSTILDTWCGEP